MRLSKSQRAALAALACVGLAGSVLEAVMMARARRQLPEIVAANRLMPQLRRENHALRQAAAEVARLRGDDAELADLRFQAVALQTKLEAAAVMPAIVPPPLRAPAPGMPQHKRIAIEPVRRAVSRSMPIYPRHLRDSGIGGAVEVRFTLAPDGTPIEPAILSTTLPDFGFAVLEAAKTWKYRPVERVDEASEAPIVVPVVFSPNPPKVSLGVPRSLRRPVPPPPDDWFE